MNPNDQKRDQILRFLHQRHASARGIAKIPIGIRDLQREMKEQFEMKQHDVASNLDYLVQVGWVAEVVKNRSFKTKAGMEVGQEQIKYKISDVGINHLERASTFKRPEATRNVNITNIKGVTVVGDGNIVNTEFTDLSRALDELEEAVARCSDIPDQDKLDIAADVATIRTQIGKQHPNRSIIDTAWETLKGVATLSSVADAVDKVGGILVNIPW
ncbi:MAG: hypothetical protein R3C10_18260 [Pirellulales bacterium]